MFNHRGYSMTMWVVTFGIVVAGLFFIRTPLKRALQGKIISSTDYLLWTSWGNSTDQYKGDESSHVKSKASQQQDTYIQEQRNKVINVGVSSSKAEQSASTGVEQGSEALLELYDLNREVR